MTTIWMAILLVFFPADNGEESARLSEKPEIHYYEVSGATAAEVRADLREKGPVGDNGVRYDGYTRWYIRWNYRLVPKGDACEVGSVETTVDVNMTLPKWVPPAGKDLPKLRQRWDRFSRALREHEDGHQRVAERAAGVIRERMGSHDPVDDCPTLSKKLNELGQAVLEEFRREEREYDRTTGHGATQGVRFP